MGRREDKRLCSYDCGENGGDETFLTLIQSCSYVSIRGTANSYEHMRVAGPERNGVILQ